MVIVIILLYLVTIINFAINWLYGFISNGWNFWTSFLVSPQYGTMIQVVLDTSATICNTLADSAMVSMTLLDTFTITYYYSNYTKIWRCWMIWGQCWLLIIPPILLLISATGKIIHILYLLFYSYNVQE